MLDDGLYKPIGTTSVHADKHNKNLRLCEGNVIPRNSWMLLHPVWEMVSNMTDSPHNIATTLPSVP